MSPLPKGSAPKREWAGFIFDIQGAEGAEGIEWVYLCPDVPGSSLFQPSCAGFPIGTTGAQLGDVVAVNEKIVAVPLRIFYNDDWKKHANPPAGIWVIPVDWCLGSDCPR